MVTVFMPQTQKTIAGLSKAYRIAIEAVTNYLASSVNLDGDRAEEVKQALDEFVQDELEHARLVAHRIKQLGGQVPGGSQLALIHSPLDQSTDCRDVEGVIRGVLTDERGAIRHYQQIIEQVGVYDDVTQELCIRILVDEEAHCARFEQLLLEHTEFQHAAVT